MNLRNLEFLIEEALTGIWRNGLMAFASISTIALSLGVLGAFVLTAISANNFTAAQVGTFQLVVFVNRDVEQDRVTALVDEIGRMNGVKNATARDRDREWADMKKLQPDFETAGLQGNPLPYALDVKVANAENMKDLAASIRSLRDVRKVTGPEEIDRVMAIFRAVKGVSIAAGLILLVTTGFIISNAIRLTLYARRREIRIMQLVGATNETIRVPLVIEGMVFGAAGALVAWVLLRLAGSYVVYSAHSISNVFREFSSHVGTAGLAVGLLFVGVAIGAVGSLISIRRFLHD